MVNEKCLKYFAKKLVLGTLLTVVAIIKPIDAHLNKEYYFFKVDYIKTKVKYMYVNIIHIQEKYIFLSVKN